MKNRIIVAVSGASGAPIAIEVLKALREQPDWETHLVISKSGEITILEESDWSVQQVCELADVTYKNEDIAAPIASGTFPVQGMVIVPCSMKTIAGIASGYSENLLLRAADVCLKERRKLVLVARETPLSAIHIQNMLRVTEAGGILLPPMASYYSRPTSVEEMTRHIAGKILDQFGISATGFKRWGISQDEKNE